jgi:hypothetical protein
LPEMLDRTMSSSPSSTSNFFHPNAEPRAQPPAAFGGSPHLEGRIPSSIFAGVNVPSRGGLRRERLRRERLRRERGRRGAHNRRDGVIVRSNEGNWTPPRRRWICLPWTSRFTARGAKPADVFLDRDFVTQLQRRQ